VSKKDELTGSILPLPLQSLAAWVALRTGAETIPLRGIPRQSRISTSFDGIAAAKIKLFPNQS
jgi:hypothetical protein